ncbi:unnamed protein product [Calypogeia fissa]
MVWGFRGINQMEDDQEKESKTGLHHFRMLFRIKDFSRDSRGGQRATLDASASPHSMVKIQRPSSTGRDEDAADVLQDGHNKYGNGNGSLVVHNFQHEPVVRSSNCFLSGHHFAKRNRAPGMQISLKERGKGAGGGRVVGFSITAADVRMILVGGLTTLLKIAGLLVARTFCGNIWPYLQVFSLCTLSIDPLKLLVPTAKKISVAPLKGLAAPVLYITIAKPIVRWGLPDAYRTARFWRRLLPIYFGYMKTKYTTKGKSQEDIEKLWAARHEWGGERVHRLVLDLSGFYVKSAQILATKADFVPEPWIRRLSNHLDNAPPRPFSEVERSIRLQLGNCSRRATLATDAQGLVPLDAAFSNVEETCIAAASIAQVHGAELKDGRRVVIKVQHLGMELVMKSDLRNIVWVAKFLEGQLPFDLGPVVREIQKTIPLEFDFEREVWFMTTVKRNLEKGGFDRIVCPEPVPDLCATRLLVMERLEGVPFTRILHPEASAELKSRLPEVVNNVEYLVLAYGQMFLQDGVFHADPHAGNLLLLSDGRLGLIDFGQSKVLDPGLRKLFAQMIVALGNNNDEEIASALLNLGMRFEDVNGGVVQSSTLALMARILFDTCYEREATVSPMAEESILRQTPLTGFNQALWLVVRAMVLLRGLCYGLSMDISSCTLWRPYALRALEEQESDPVQGKFA